MRKWRTTERVMKVKEIPEETFVEITEGKKKSVGEKKEWMTAEEKLREGEKEKEWETETKTDRKLMSSAPV